MPKQLQTALEARRWMVANQGCRLKDVYLGRWQWEESSAQFINWAKGADYPSDDHAPFTILDEPEVKTDPQDGTLYSDKWVAKHNCPDGSVVITDEVQTADGVTLTGFRVTANKQPEWVRVQVSAAAYGMTQTPTHRWAVTPSEALQHICQQAKQVRITWPEWINSLPDSYDIDEDGATLGQADFIDQALRMSGAVVEYLPKEGK